MIFDWNDEKNEQLKAERGISFEEIVWYIENGSLLGIMDNPNYPNQRLFAVKIEDYVYLVPFVKKDDGVFLKTLYPSRKMTKRLLGNQEDHE